MERMDKMDNMKSEILKNYLKDDVKKWEMAEQIFNYTHRKKLLSSTQFQMIEEFLDEDEGNKSLAKDISDNFEDLLSDQIKKMSTEIIAYVKSKFTHIESGEFGGLATSNHYINFDLKNDVRIQFNYKNNPYFNFQYIRVGLYSTKLKKDEIRIIFKKIDPVNIDSFKDDSIYVNKNYKFVDDNNFYNVIFDKNERQRLVENHSVIYDILKKIITTYNIDLQNELE